MRGSFSLPDGEAWSIPWDYYRQPELGCYGWWGDALSRASAHGLGIEVVVVTGQGQSGFRFHLPGSGYVPTYRGSPLDEAARLSRTARENPALRPTRDVQAERPFAEHDISNREWAAGYAEDLGMDVDLWLDTQLRDRD